MPCIFRCRRYERGRTTSTLRSKRKRSELFRVPPDDLAPRNAHEEPHAMSETFAEILLLIPTTLSAGLCMFIACVIQNVMNEMDELAFKHFLTRLFRNALKSPFNIITSLLTSIGAVPYFIAYGFNHLWFTAGVAFFCTGINGEQDLQSSDLQKGYDAGV
jgi:hypothetical protein